MSSPFPSLLSCHMYIHMHGSHEHVHTICTFYINTHRNISILSIYLSRQVELEFCRVRGMGGQKDGKALGLKPKHDLKGHKGRNANANNVTTNHTCVM